MGYGYASVCLIQALQRKQIRVDFLNEEALLHVSFVQPEWYKGTSKQFRVGYTPWESTVLPPLWKDTMLSMDEIWTTSKFCQDIFASYDIESKVLPHGIDPDYFTINDRTVTDKFLFFHAGSPTERKGSQMVVDAFIDVFDKKTDVGLVLKSSGPTNARWIQNGNYFGNAGHHPQIFVVEHDLELEDLVALYHRTHCFIYPTNGEGFGFFPFQAIATGQPTICTNLTGCADFAELSIPLSASWGPGEGVHLGEWALPDPDHLRELMRYVYENWEEEKKVAMKSARIIHNTQTWDHIADQVIAMVGDKLERTAR